MRVLITGGAGFIGTNLRRRLEHTNSIEKILIVDDLSTGHRENLKNLDGKTSFVEASICDTNKMRLLVSEVDVIFHLAAIPSVSRSIQFPRTTTDVNVSGTIELLELIREFNSKAHLIFASSSSVYGRNQKLPKHEQLGAMPVSPYAASKLTGEVYALAYQQSFGIPVTAFRFFNVYGPFQRPGHAYAAVVPAFLEAALLGHPIPIHGDGLQTRDFTFVGTLVDALTNTALGRLTSNDPVNLAFGTRTNLLQLIEVIELQLDRKLARIHLPVRPGDVRDSQADNNLLRTLIPSLSQVQLEHGISETIYWMKDFLEQRG